MSFEKVKVKSLAQDNISSDLSLFPPGKPSADGNACGC